MAASAAELRSLLGPGFQVDQASGRRQQLEQMLEAYSMMVSISSVVALFIGMFIIYVIQVERQTGEWSLVGGYAGQAVTNRRAPLTFAPDRGMTRSLVGRVSYTIDTNRSLPFEAAVRQDASGMYAKTEYSRAQGQHWRTTMAGALIRGEPGDFLESTAGTPMSR